MRQTFDDKTIHLTYCLNIHPGETWEENLAAIRTHACAVRDRVCPGKPFGLGLRASDASSRQLLVPDTLAQFREFLDAENLYVFTVNGFPYGQFHGAKVKEHVYSPDWATQERVDYTVRLARILAALLPEGVPGSISTVPGTYRAWCKSPNELNSILGGLNQACTELAKIRTETGHHIRLGLEPEPDCFWDTTRDMVELFENTIPWKAAPLLASACGVSAQRAEMILYNHLGVCFDTCHLATLFEDVPESLQQLSDAGVPIAKIQISAAPACAVEPGSLDALAAFVDPVYLHQSCLRDAAGKLHRFPDLPEALAAAREMPDGGELRTHFHIPLGASMGGPLQSTRAALDDRFFAMVKQGISDHIEVETYTFDVLPADLRAAGVVASVAAELEWVLDQLRPGAELEKARE